MATISKQIVRSKRRGKTATAKPRAKRSVPSVIVPEVEVLPPEKKGTGKRGPGKATSAAREAIGKFVDGNAHRLQKWLDEIAEGKPPMLDARKKPIPYTAVAPNPEKAAALFIQVIEYHVPKLARTEHSGDPENPVRVVLSAEDSKL
ncbi:MAG: hypothetical protein WC736_15590 [Gallionella sp.]|jgi:hypothetical protein